MLAWEVDRSASGLPQSAQPSIGPDGARRPTGGGPGAASDDGEGLSEVGIPPSTIVNVPWQSAHVPLRIRVS